MSRFFSRENRLTWYILGAMLLTFFFAIAVTSCNRQPVYGGVPGYAAPVVGAAPMMQAPVVVAAPHHDGFFSGMLMGSLLSGSNRTVNSSTTIVQRAPTVTTTAPAQRYAAPATTYRPSQSWTNSRSVTTTRSSSGISVGRRR